ncbi:MAG: hypothetical protein WCF90_03215 [Methanomicrobiales archaeon]
MEIWPEQAGRDYPYLVIGDWDGAGFADVGFHSHEISEFTHSFYGMDHEIAV